MTVGSHLVARARRSRAGSPAFTLIELLVVIVIIALLISILMPALKQARTSANMLREQAACRSEVQSWALYATTYHEGLLIPGVPWSWAHPASPSKYYASPPDPLFMSGMTQGGPGAPSDTALAGTASVNAPAPAPAPLPASQPFIEGSAIKVWPLRLWGFQESPGYEIQIDKKTYATFRSRSLTPTATQQLNGETINTYDSGNTFVGSMSYHPTFGMNAVFNGGHYRMGAYINSTAMLVSGPYTHFTRKTYDITRPSSLLVFASARSVDLASSAMSSADYGGKGVPYTGGAAIVPGFHMVTPPKFGTIPTNMPTVSGATSPGAWVPSDTFKQESDPASWGFLDARWFGSKVTAGFSDGHVEPQTLKELRDMRKWSNKADKADWTPNTK